MEDSLQTNKHFWKGALCGALAMFLVIGAAIGVANHQNINLFGRLNPGQSQVDAATEKKLEKLKRIIDQKYLYSDEVGEEDLREGIYSGFIAALEDPYSVYYDEEATQKLLEATSGEYSGIGVVMSQDQDTRFTKAVTVYKNSPAEKAGIKEEDIIYKVDGVDVTGWDISKIAQTVRGTTGTKVKVTVLRGEDAQELEFVLTRDVVEVETVAYEMKEGQVGYIRVSEFDEVTYSQFEMAMNELEQAGAKGLVIDLRGNPGGSVSTVTNMLDLLLPKGVIVYTEDKYGEKNYLTSDDAHQYQKPVAVLVNGNSASASEIFAGAAQDYELGPIVGTTTYGKGVVQEIVDLGDGSCVKITISEYYTPKGRSINKKGIEPDVVVEYEPDEEHPEADNQLDVALEQIRQRTK